MRQAFFRFPWAHIGEYESQIAAVIVDRNIGDEDMIFLAPLIRPEEQSLLSLNDHLRRYQNDPIESIKSFRFIWRLARLPQFLRRLSIWLALNVLPRRRARHFGTFAVTTMSPFGARSIEVPSIWSAMLHYGTISETGEVPVGIVFDHRLMHGSVVGHTLMEMEQVLHHEIVAELRDLRGTQAA